VEAPSFVGIPKSPKGNRRRSASFAKDQPVPDPEFSTAAIDPATDELFRPLRRELGVESLGINQITLQPGQRMRVHVHERQDEVYLVLEGTLTLIVEAEEHTLGAGTLARVGPRTRRQIGNRGNELAVLLVVGAAGEHVSRDARAWGSWDEEGEGRSPREVPLPPDFED
jgi:mannose-6-phosphate isomerase-like protein (cupin superfamily)